jgi:hypothetical protein
LQGSDSLASWQANLLFEPAKFEVSIDCKLSQLEKSPFEEKIDHILTVERPVPLIKYCV